MAIVILALNGEGLGHLIRTMTVCNVLEAAGERPIVFSQGIYRPDGAVHFPAMYVPSLWRATDDLRKRVASDLYTMAALSLPAIIVEDTHPNPIHLPSDVRRVLLVRPTSFEYLLRLRDHYGSVYEAFILCDSPGSPTWPYDDLQTSNVASWDKWYVNGPIYRTATELEMRAVRTRYHLEEDEDVCIFTMGGGGLHNQSDKDVERFLHLCSQVADVIQRPKSKVRLIFVQGPYFPKTTIIPSRFEVVPDEKQMHALLGIAKGAVIRAGFNTTWECLAAKTPFIPLIGTTFGEPVVERVGELKKTGLLPADIHQFWWDREWRDFFSRSCEKLIRQYPATPKANEFQRLITGHEPLPNLNTSERLVRHFPKSPPPARKVRVGSKRRLPLVIRIDDVACSEPTVSWLFDLLASRKLHASVEVVPYLAKIDDRFLDQFDPSNTLFEVSQHGYAHVPRRTNTGKRCEFYPNSVSPTDEEIIAITAGKKELERAFPKRFTGGFSPPFDALPHWLPGVWYGQGGTFVSCLYTNHIKDSPIAILRAGVDIWDWAGGSAIRRDRLERQLVRQAYADLHIGIVVHPRCLRSREKERLLSILNFLDTFGTYSSSLRELAEARAIMPFSKAKKLSERFRLFFSKIGSF